MLIACIGISHNTANVELREQLHIGSRTYRGSAPAPVYERLRAEMAEAGIGEHIVLSTCNRTEFYFAERSLNGSALQGAMSVFIRVLSDHSQQLASALYGYEGRSAVRHLCRVACGLESLVIGETEVLGQVVAAHRDAEREENTGPITDELFHAAIRAGRRARAETGISRKAVSVVSESIQLVLERFPNADTNIAIVGTGKMSKLACTLLASRKHNVTIVGRTAENAVALANHYGMQVKPWEKLSNVLATSHAVITSTAASSYVIDTEMAQYAMSLRSENAEPLLVVDIALPRDVHPSVATIAGIELHNLDDLQKRLRNNVDERAQHIPHVEEVIEQELAAFDAWCTASEVRPVLADIHAGAERLRQSEYSKLLQRHPWMDERTKNEIEAFSNRLVKKLLDAPSRRLREERDPQRLTEIADAAKELFLESPSRSLQQRRQPS